MGTDTAGEIVVLAMVSEMGFGSPEEYSVCCEGIGTPPNCDENPVGHAPPPRSTTRLIKPIAYGLEFEIEIIPKTAHVALKRLVRSTVNAKSIFARAAISKQFRWWKRGGAAIKPAHWTKRYQ